MWCYVCEAGGLFALFFGALYILITLAEAEGMSQNTLTSVPESEQKPEIEPEAVVKASLAHEEVITSVTLPYEASKHIETAELEVASMGRR